MPPNVKHSAAGMMKIASICTKLVSALGFSYGFVCGVGVEEAATVGAEHLDRLLRRDRAHRQGLRLRGGFLGDGVALGILERIACASILGCRTLVVAVTVVTSL